MVCLVLYEHYLQHQHRAQEAIQESRCLGEREEGEPRAGVLGQHASQCIWYAQSYTSITRSTSTGGRRRYRRAAA